MRSYIRKFRTQLFSFQSLFHSNNELFIETKNCLLKHKVRNENIIRFEVPGSFEIPYLVKNISKKSHYNFDAIITLGCIIKGDTPHFEVISNSITNEILKLNTESKIPIRPEGPTTELLSGSVCLRAYKDSWLSTG